MVLCSSLLEMCVQSLKLIVYAAFVLELVKCHHPETFPKRNSSNYENCNIKFSLNTFSNQIIICQIFLWKSLTSNKSILQRKSKYLNYIRVFPFFISFFCWNETNTKSSVKEERRKMENCKADNTAEKLFRSYWK